MNHQVHERNEPDPIPEDSPTNDVSDHKEGQGDLSQHNLPAQQMQQSWPMQLPVGHPLAGHATSQQPPPISVNPGNPALLQFYEAQMRDHAAAYASAAAAAAMTAAQIAANIASSSGTFHNHPQQQQPYGHPILPDIQYPNSVPMSPMPSVAFPDSPQMYPPSSFMSSHAGPSYQHQPFVPVPPQPQYYENEPSRSPEDNHANSHHHHRRKRQQRIPPSGFSGSANSINTHSGAASRQHPQHYDTFGSGGPGGGNWLQPQGQQKRGRRRRRFWNDAGSSDSGDPSYNNHCSNNCNDGNDNSNNRRRNRKMAKAAASSSSDGGSASWITKKKQRQPNDDSLLGKTGVSALYEWCMKRRTTPTFSMRTPNNNSDNNGRKKVTDQSGNDPTHEKESPSSSADTQQHQPPLSNGDEGKRRRLELEHDFFETTVSIDGVEMGKGRGRTKTAAKHEASRRALLTLLPGVEFDEETGILVRLPGGMGPYSSEFASGRRSATATTITSLEDLAPNLAKQLAIGHSNDDDDDRGTEKGRSSSELATRDFSRKRQKWPHVYPGTSTTSDDEDEDSYYASRGAYVCSSLLHAMVQIDERLTDPPEFTYQVSAITNEPGGEHSKLKRKASVPIKATSTAIPRGSFQCTGILKLKVTTGSNADSAHPEDTDDVDSFDDSSSRRLRDCYRLLRSFGVGGTKREARHTAAAQLLSQLFPECEGMAQVKQAAEAAREKYAASRALKQQSKREALFTATSRGRNRFQAMNGSESIPSNLLWTSGASKNTPPVPAIIQEGFSMALGNIMMRRPMREDDSFTSSVHQSSTIASSKASGIVRQLSRQHQLEEKIDSALQKLNEHDEEGRSLPEELTADDVGRTVLRRAGTDDIYWVEKLFRTKSLPKHTADASPLFGTILASDKVPPSMSMRLWSSSTIVLLLCRAIAPHEDPPLGCAVLTLGFSMQKGKILRIAQIASKSHQPRERFIETLSKFATNMECSLISSPSKPSFVSLEKESILRELTSNMDSPKSHLQETEILRSTTIRDTIDLSMPIEENRVKPSLQSVEEEGEGAEESDSSSPNDGKAKRRAKPSKRSRFQ